MWFQNESPELPFKCAADLELWLRNSEGITHSLWVELQWRPISECFKGIFCVRQNRRIQSHMQELILWIHKIQRTRIKEWIWRCEKVKKTIKWGPKYKCGSHLELCHQTERWRRRPSCLLWLAYAVRAAPATKKAVLVGATPTLCSLHCLPLIPK